MQLKLHSDNLGIKRYGVVIGDNWTDGRMRGSYPFDQIFTSENFEGLDSMIGAQLGSKVNENTVKRKGRNKKEDSIVLRQMLREL